MWVAEYTRGPFLLNLKEFKAESKQDAEFQAWQGWMHLANDITIDVWQCKRAGENITTLSERKRETRENRIRRVK